MMIRGGWQLDRIEAFLRETVIPVRLGLNRSSGHPLVVSLWFWYDAGSLWCATAASSEVGRLVAQNPLCGFEVGGDQPPYRGVRGSALAAVVRDRGDEVLEVLARRYLGEQPSLFKTWLLSRDEVEVAVRLEPVSISSWDYSARMAADS